MCCQHGKNEAADSAQKGVQCPLGDAQAQQHYAYAGGEKGVQQIDLKRVSVNKEQKARNERQVLEQRNEQNGTVDAKQE